MDFTNTVTTDTLTEALAAQLVRPVDDETLGRAALHVHDWIGCAFAGAAQPVGVALAAAIQAEGSGPCVALGQSESVSPAAAAFHNGGLGNVLEMDDIHRTSILHPGPVVIPAALAAAQWIGASPQRFLMAVVRGYEAVIRIGRSVGPGHYALWHNTSTCGGFGAAAAVADLMDLTPEQTVWALGNAGAQSSGPFRCLHEPVMTKQLHTAHAAQAGLKSAMLAGCGFTGPRAMLEGEQGFYAAMAPDADPEAVMAAPDAPWLIWETSFKPWPSCRHTHPAIDAALILYQQNLPLNAAIRVRIETYRDGLVICDQAVPTTEALAKFSLQHAVAVTLRNGPPALDQFRGSSLTDLSVAELRSRCVISATKRFENAYPDHYGAAVIVEFQDGHVVEASCPDALGDPENPLAPEAVRTKAQTLMVDAGLEDDAIADIRKACVELPCSESLSALTQALTDCRLP